MGRDEEQVNMGKRGHMNAFFPILVVLVVLTTLVLWVSLTAHPAQASERGISKEPCCYEVYSNSAHGGFLWQDLSGGANLVGSE